MSIRWATAFLDGPVSAAAERFWTAVTATTLSTRRGPRDEYATLLPTNGDAYLRVHHTLEGAPGVHLVLHAVGVASTARKAFDLGAETVPADLDADAVTVRSPGGFRFSIVAHRGEVTRPGPVVHRDDNCCTMLSRLDQLCLDIPAATFDAEADFWADLTGWPRRAGSRPEFDHLVRPDGMPFRLLLQRVGGSGPVRAHLDVAAGDDVAPVVAWHRTLGATWVHDGAGWTTLRDPVGREYCVTARDPSTGTIR